MEDGQEICAVLEATALLPLHSIQKLGYCLFHVVCIWSPLEKLFVLFAGIMIFLYEFSPSSWETGGGSGVDTRPPPACLHHGIHGGIREILHIYVWLSMYIQIISCTLYEQHTYSYIHFLFVIICIYKACISTCMGCFFLLVCSRHICYVLSTYRAKVQTAP